MGQGLAFLGFWGKRRSSRERQASGPAGNEFPQQGKAEGKQGEHNQKKDGARLSRKSGPDVPQAPGEPLFLTERPNFFP